MNPQPPPATPANENQAYINQTRSNQGLGEAVTGYDKFNEKFGSGFRVRHGAPLFFYTANAEDSSDIAAASAQQATQPQTTFSLDPVRRALTAKAERRRSVAGKQRTVVTWLPGSDATAEITSISVRRGAPLIAFTGEAEKNKLVARKKENVDAIFEFLNEDSTRALDASNYFGTWIGRDAGGIYAGFDEAKFRAKLKELGFGQGPNSAVKLYNCSYGDLEQAAIRHTRFMANNASIGTDLMNSWRAIWENNNGFPEREFKRLHQWALDANGNEIFEAANNGLSTGQ